MSVKFTPGPWFYDEKNNAIRQCAGENGNLFICGIDDRSRTDTANARLIAAAPELLEALERCFEAICAGPDHKFSPELTTQELALIYAQKAIAKAKGG